MLIFVIHRNDSNKSATDLDMGDIEFVLNDQTISSRGNSRFSNMIYVSIVDLIDGLLRLDSGEKCHEFVAADSSFLIRFEKGKHGLHLSHSKDKYGPISWRELLQAINSGIDLFLSDPRNALSTDNSMHHDFDASRIALKNALTLHNLPPTPTFQRLDLENE